jgi:hypothetical protein
MRSETPAKPPVLSNTTRGAVPAGTVVVLSLMEMIVTGTPHIWISDWFLDGTIFTLTACPSDEKRFARVFGTYLEPSAVIIP